MHGRLQSHCGHRNHGAHGSAAHSCPSRVCMARRSGIVAPRSAEQQQPLEQKAGHAAAAVQLVPNEAVSRRAWLLGVAAGPVLLELLAAAGPGCQPVQAIAADLVPAVLRPERAPDQSVYNPADPDLRAAAQLIQSALNAETVEQEEALWSQVIQQYSGVNAVWMPDVVGRAYGNRGNARSRQGKLAAALSDLNAAIQLCPWSVDPVINRGVVLEALGRWNEAAADYNAVLAVAPDDPSAWNNLGNTNMGMRNWKEAERCFGKAAALAPSFSFAAANRALALFQLGETEQAIRDMRGLLRRYPDFPDMRAALAAAQWAAGREGDAETNWERVEDPRYRDVAWLRRERRWPPALADSLQAFLQLKSI